MKGNMEEKSEYDILIEALIEKFMSEGMSEFEARMKAVMSDEALGQVYPTLYPRN